MIIRLASALLSLSLLPWMPGCATSPEGQAPTPAGTAVEEARTERRTVAPDQGSEHASSHSLFDGIGPDTPGAAFVIVKDGHVIDSGGFGSANLQHDIPMTVDTVVDIASVSKQFTAFGVLLLANDGLLSLDDDIRDHIPELPDYGDVMTLRHLLTHTSGLREWIQLFHMSGYKIGGDIVYRDHVFNLIVNQKGKNFPAGESFAYSNSGYDLLAIVIERVTGKTFSAFTRERIFQPLGMNDTFVRDNDQIIIRNGAARYFADDDGYGEITHQLGFGGSGGIHSTMSDLGRWISNFQQPEVGSTALFEIMNEQAVLNNGETISAALGQFSTSYHGLREYQHSGGGVGINTHLARFPDQALGVAVVCNHFECDPRSKAEALADHFLGETASDPVSPRITQPIELDPTELDAFVAHYWNEDSGLAREVYRNGDALWYKRSEGNESKLIAVTEREFQFEGFGDHTRLSFGRDNTGRRTMSYVYSQDPPQRFVEYEPKTYSSEALEVFAGLYRSDELMALLEIRVDQDGLTAGTRRGVITALRPVITDTFSGDRYAFGSVRFLRDPSGDITSFVVSNPTAKGVQFHRLQTPAGDDTRRETHP